MRGVVSASAATVRAYRLDRLLPFMQSRPMSMTIRRQASVLLMVSTLAVAAPASAQKVTTVEEVTLKQTLSLLADPLSSRPSGEAIGAATALEIATTPFGTSSGGFVFKLDPTTGLQARTATTFGPSFGDRAITVGEGQVSVGATFSNANYDQLSGNDINRLQIGTTASTQPRNALDGFADLRFTARTTLISGTVGVSENLDIGAVIPLVSVKLLGTSSLVNGLGVNTRLAVSDGVFSGLGDTGALVKYRFYKFKADGLIDPGGLAVAMNMRLPTGNKDNLLGLGINRTMVSLIGSRNTGRIQPHASGGFEYWSKSLDIKTSVPQGTRAEARHQIQYAAGIEVEANPKVTLNIDFLGQHILGAGQVGYVTDTVPANANGVTSIQSLVALSDGISKALLVPGLKVNLKSKMLLSVNALITLKNNGLHATVTPVVGINLTK